MDEPQNMNQRRAFTIIELLAAAALAALLMTCVLGTMSTLAVKSKKLASQSTTESWKRRLVDQLSRDLANSRLIEQSDAGFTLIGFAAIDESLTSPHAKSKVWYLVDEESELLVRYQDTPPRGDVICKDAVGIRYEALTRTGVTNGDSLPVPQRIRLVIDGNSNEPLLDQVLYVR